MPRAAKSGACNCLIGIIKCLGRPEIKAAEYFCRARIDGSSAAGFYYYAPRRAVPRRRHRLRSCRGPDLSPRS